MLTGSSQLTRGTLGGSDIRAGLCRFIPACAGNSSKSMPGAPSNTGSSPLTRGTLELILTRQPSQRFIPAYAGNSRQERPSGAKSTVHPRLRGELPAPIAAVAVMDGSSPLTRGTQTIVFRVLRRVRFIPAYAGNSQDNRRGRKLAPGSSPLTRGTRSVRVGAVQVIRFIPAYAGNSSRNLF